MTAEKKGPRYTTPFSDPIGRVTVTLGKATPERDPTDTETSQAVEVGNDVEMTGPPCRRCVKHLID
jgi:hypothetical protein